MVSTLFRIFHRRWVYIKENISTYLYSYFFFQHLIYILIFPLPRKFIFHPNMYIFSIIHEIYNRTTSNTRHTRYSIFTRMEIRSGSFSSLFEKPIRWKLLELREPFKIWIPRKHRETLWKFTVTIFTVIYAFGNGGRKLNGQHFGIRFVDC